MSATLAPIGELALDVAIFMGWWFLLSLVVAAGWSIFHMRLKRRQPARVPAEARLRLVVPRPKAAPDSESAPSKPSRPAA